MRIGWFIALAAISFIIATAGSDVFSEVVIGGQSVSSAVRQHFYWAALEFVGTLSLLAPFLILAAIGAWVKVRTGTWKGVTVFAIPTIYLIYSYFEGYRSAAIAELHKHWTAAAVSIGFLPLAAVPVLLLAWLFGYLVVFANRPTNDGH